MVSRENRILLVAIPVAIALGVVVLPALGAPEWLSWGALIVLGAIVPTYLADRRRSDDEPETDA